MFESADGQTNGTTFSIQERPSHPALIRSSQPPLRPAMGGAREAMSTKTQTTTTHYHIQKKRRKEFLEEWRNYRQTVIRKEDVKLEKTARGLRTGVYMGWDGDRPTRCLDALVHEIDPGV